MGVAAFTLLMVAVTLFREILKYMAEYGLTLGQVSVFFLLALPQTVAYTFPMAILFAGLLAFGRLSDSSQITALRAGGIGFFRIVLPALIFAWFVVLFTFILNEKIAPQSTRAGKMYIQNAMVDQGITVSQYNISYMDNEAGWLFAAASGEGNVFYNVKWWDFSRPGEITLYTADEGIWEMGRWEFHNANVIHLGIGNGNGVLSNGDGEDIADDEAGAINDREDLESLVNGGNVVRSMQSEKLEMWIARTPSDILAEAGRNPEEMSLQELHAFIEDPPDNSRYDEQYLRKIEANYHMKIAAPFASIVFTLLAAPLGLAPQRSTSTMGIGLSMLLVFGYYILTTFAIKVAEGGGLPPVVAAWIPNLLFLIAGGFLNARFYIRSA
jgi:lipopolysaccharide export system permease protein